MKVILLQDIKNVGKRGNVKSVSDGFARNYLLPRNLAAVATSKLVNKFQQEEKHEQEKKDKQKTLKNKSIDELRKTPIVFNEKSTPEGTLFSSISSEKISKKLLEITGHEISIDKIILDKPIKQIGTHTVEIRINDQIIPLIIKITD